MRPKPLLDSFRWLISRPIAHRGLHDAGENRIENTKSAFEAAVRAGYAIECDVQLAADGVPVVFHDQLLDRLTREKGPLIRHTAAELKKVELRDTGDGILRLDELVNLVNGSVPLFIELKSLWNGDRRLAANSAEILAGYKGNFALMSFDPELLISLRADAPHMIRGVVADRMTDASWQLPLGKRLALRYFKHWNETLPHFLSFDAKGLPWTPVRRLRAAGLPVITWTVRSPEQASRVRRYCDQITFEGFRP